MNAKRFVHLLFRFREMGQAVISECDDAEFARGVLLQAEFELWMTMNAFDRRHSVSVARRFVSFLPAADRDEVAAALLHDVGKSLVSMGRVARVIATVLPVSRQMRTYRRHESIGASLLRERGVAERTVELVAGVVDDDVARLLRAADDAR